VIFPITGDGAPATRHFVPLGGSARHLTLGGPDGPALVPDESDDQFLTVALPSGRVLDSVHVGRQPHEAFTVGPSTYWVADELANTYHIVHDGTVVRIVPAPLQPGGGAASLDDRYVVGVGVRGRRITEYTAAGAVIGSANCGAGPTHVVTGADGLFWVNDTNGGAVLGFTLTAHGPKQVASIPVGAGSKPYGIAYDSQRNILWVTLTGRDQLLGLTFRGTRVVARSLRPTVQQPNTVAVFPATGEVVVTGSTPAGHLQLLPL
jgi:DNA-binding beta-propeller fold protein YncE